MPPRQRGSAPTAALCRAPFTSLRFNPGGKVFPCSQNMHYVLGRYPEQSLARIWDGARMAALRAELSNSRFAPGCGDCARAAVTHGHGAAKARCYDALSPNDGYPAMLDFKLESTCNLACIMCSSYSSSHHRTTPGTPGGPRAVYDSRFIAQLSEFLARAKEAHFTGGEPFRIEVYYRIWERLAELNPCCAIWVQTNATVLDRRVERVLERGQVGLNVSIDSLERRTFEAIRVGARFPEVRRNLELFRGHCARRGTRFNVNTAVQRRNWREVPAIVEYCNDLDAQVFFCYVCCPVEHALWALPATDLAGIGDFYDRVSLPEDTPVRRQNKERFRDLQGAVRSWHAAALARERAPKAGDVSAAERRLRDSLEKGCRSLVSSAGHGPLPLGRLRQRLAALLARPEEKRRVCDYIGWCLDMFGPDLVLDSLLNEPLDRIRQDIRHFR